MKGRPAQTIKQRRLKLAIKQYDFAKAIGVTPAMLSNYEKGITKPSPARLAKIERAFKRALARRMRDMAGLAAEGRQAGARVNVGTAETSAA